MLHHCQGEGRRDLGLQCHVLNFGPDQIFDFSIHPTALLLSVRQRIRGDAVFVCINSNHMPIFTAINSSKLMWKFLDIVEFNRRRHAIPDFGLYSPSPVWHASVYIPMSHVVVDMRLKLTPCWDAHSMNLIHSSKPLRSAVLISCGPYFVHLRNSLRSLFKKYRAWGRM